MNRNFYLVSVLFGSLGLMGCVGDIPEGENADVTPDAGDVEETPDAGEDVEVVELAVSGKVMDYFAVNLGNLDVVANANLATEGLDPSVQVVADALGLFTMDILPTSLFYVNVTAPGYAPTRNEQTQLLDVALEKDVYAASLAGVLRQYEGAGGGVVIPQIAGNGTIMLDLSRNNGEPAVGVPVADIVLATVDAPLDPIGNAFLVDPGSTDLSPIDVTLESIVDGTGRARAGFINVPPGDYNVSVTIPAGGGGGGGGGDGGIQTVLVTVAADGVTFASSAAGGDGGGGGGGGGGQAAIVLDPNAPLGFTEDIYPVLMTVAEGGDGCVICHDANHILPFTGTPEETLALLNLEAVDPLGVPRINLLVPEDSPFVTNPVYEAIPNHPNAFWTVNSNHYKGIIAWIVQGAALLQADAVLPLPPEDPPPAP